MKEEVAKASPEPRLRARFSTGVAWNAIGAVFTQGGVFVVNLILANVLGRDVFGEFSFVQTTVLTLSGIGQMATGTTATKYVAEHRFTNRQRVGRILGLCSIATLAAGLILWAALLLTAPWLAGSFLNVPHVSRELTMASAYVLFSALSGFQTGALAGLEAYRVVAKAGVVTGVLHVVVCSSAAWRWGLDGAIIAVVVSSVGRWLVLSVASRHEAERQGIVVAYKDMRHEWSILFVFALPTMLIGVSTLVSLWLANAFLVRRADGFTQMALFTAALNFKTLVLFLPFLLNSVALSLLNSQKGIGASSQYRKVFWANVGMAGAVVLGPAAMIAITGLWLLRLYGEGFAGAYPAMILLLAAAVFEAIGSAASLAIHSGERVWFFLFAIALPRDVLVIILAYVLAQAYGAYGLALAYCVPWITASVGIGMAVYFMGLEIDVRRPGEIGP